MDPEILKRLEALEAKAPGAGGWIPPSWLPPALGTVAAGVAAGAPFLIAAGHSALTAVLGAVVAAALGYCGVKSVGVRS